MLGPLEDFKANLLAVLVKYFPSLDQLTSDLIKMIEDFRIEHDLGTNDLILDFGTCDAGKIHLYLKCVSVYSSHLG